MVKFVSVDTRWKNIVPFQKNKLIETKILNKFTGCSKLKIFCWQLSFRCEEKNGSKIFPSAENRKKSGRISGQCGARESFSAAHVASTFFNWTEKNLPAAQNRPTRCETVFRIFFENWKLLWNRKFENWKTLSRREKRSQRENNPVRKSRTKKNLTIYHDSVGVKTWRTNGSGTNQRAGFKNRLLIQL